VTHLLGGGLMPAHHLDERDSLLAYLARQRELVFWKLDGLDDDKARTVATPSGMTIHGVVRHLENVERSWIRRHFAGQDGLHYDWNDEDPDGDMHVPADITLVSLLVQYRAEIERCDEVIAARGLDDISVHGDHTLRWVVLHLIEEIGRHVGHLDLLAELADGRVGEEPDTASPPGVDA
jgi:uncharacterized damage-inducible protein DinB